MNEKLQKEKQNLSFSFQGQSEKPSPMPADFNLATNYETTNKKNPQKRKFFSTFETPMKALSEKSEGEKRSQGKLLRKSIVEGLKFIHEKDENQEEMDIIKEFEKNNKTDLTQDKVFPHLFGNKTREKKKLKDVRDEYKRKKSTFKQKYNVVRESSLKKMKGILTNDIKNKKLK